MVHLFENNHYGLFDLSTLGLWANVNRLESYPDFAEINRLLMLSQAAMPNEQHIDFLNSIEEDEKKQIALSAFSLYVHESRHWHDFSSTPFGLYYFVQNFSLVTGLLINLDKIISKKAIYIPINEWHKNLDLLSSFHEDLGNLPGEIEPLIKLKIKLQKILIDPIQILGRELSNIQILEGLAILHQEIVIEKCFGKANLILFQKSLKESKTGKWYYEAIDLIDEHFACSKDEKCLILYLSLFGCPLPQYRMQLKTLPVEILEDFLKVLKREKPAKLNDLHSLLTKCIGNRQGLDPTECLNETIKNASPHLNSMRESIEDTGDRELIGKFMILWQQIVNVFAFSIKFNEKFKLNPKSVLGEEYLWVAYNYFTPVIYFQAEIGIFFKNEMTNVFDTLVGYHINPLDNSMLDDAPDKLKSVLKHFIEEIPKDGGVGSLVYMPKPNQELEHFNVVKLFYILLYGKILFEGMGSFTPWMLECFWKTNNIHQEVYSNYEKIISTAKI
jgi:hypothetical protein